MTALLDKPESPAVQQILLAIAKEYPNVSRLFACHGVVDFLKYFLQVVINYIFIIWDARSYGGWVCAQVHASRFYLRV